MIKTLFLSKSDKSYLFLEKQRRFFCYFSRKQRKLKIVIEKDNKGNEPPSQNDLDPHQHNTRIADHFLNDVTNQEDIENSNGCGNSVKVWKSAYWRICVHFDKYALVFLFELWWYSLSLFPIK